jgi:hypothetical protein
MDFGNQIAAEISKTGYVLEHEIAQHLKTKSWSVISGKYYVDDSEETPREMDLIAYRVSRLDNDEADLYTVLIISCKKSDENAWALLARDANLKDANTDYWPLHAWSNDPALTYQLARPARSKAYHDGVRALGVLEAMADPQVDIFAFQEMNKTTGAPKNDKAIFAAMMSLVKAQAYELASLPTRKKTKAVYQFNLISVVGSDMYRLMFAAAGTGISSTKIESEHHVARYIVSKRESFSRIRFLTSRAFASALDDYARLHIANVRWFSVEHAAFYKDVMADEKRVNARLNDFHAKIKHHVKLRVESQFKNLKNFLEEPFLFWDAKTNTVELVYFESDDITEWMGSSDSIKKVVEEALNAVYRYAGPFRFS